MIKDAILSDDRKFRYSLSRIWDDSKLRICFVGLNPSIADDKIDDPTIIRCINFTKDWGYGGFYMVNLFAFRATDPNELYSHVDIIGPENDKIIKEIFEKSEMVICVWGNQGVYKQRNEDVLKLIVKPFCLQINGSGEPAHPLYLKKDLKPIEYIRGAKRVVSSTEEKVKSEIINIQGKTIPSTSSLGIKVRYFSKNDQKYLDELKTEIGFNDTFLFEVEISDGEKILGEKNILIFGMFILLFRQFKISELYEKASFSKESHSKFTNNIIPLDIILAFKAAKQKNIIFLEIETESGKSYKTVKLNESNFTALDRLQLKLNELLPVNL